MDFVKAVNINRIVKIIELHIITSLRGDYNTKGVAYMTKTQIKRDLLQGNDGAILISISKVAELTTMGRDRARKMLKDLQYDPRGNAKMYYVDEVAKILAERMTL